MKKIYILTLLICLTCFGTSFAQTLKGHIYDAKTNEPLVGAAVTYKLHGNQGVVSNINGTAGAYLVQHSYLCALYHPGAVPDQPRSPLLRHQRPVQQPYHGGPETAQKPQRPHSRHPRLRQVVQLQAGDHQRVSRHGGRRAGL